MNFMAPSRPPGVRREVASGQKVALATAGDTYISTLVRLMEIGDLLKVQSDAIEHARERATKRDWAGVQIGLAVLCAAAQDIRKIAAATNDKFGPDIDSATEVYRD